MLVNTISIQLNTIDPPTWNSRLPKTGAALKAEQGKLESLASSLTREGQITPIEVDDLGNGRYELCIGSRRVAAARALGWKEIKANVYTGRAPGDKIHRNIVENAQRENLTTYELARSAAQLRDLGLKNPEIAPIIGISSSHVSNLNTAYSGLPAPVLKAWEANHPVANVPTLCEIARKGKDDGDKARKWDEAVSAAKARADETGATPGKRGKGKDKATSNAKWPIDSKRLGHVINALSSKEGSPELEEDNRKWAKALLDYVLGGRETPPAGVPALPPKEPKPAKAPKAPKDGATLQVV